jgi:flagellar P-ring protein precursor FlgI
MTMKATTLLALTALCAAAFAAPDSPKTALKPPAADPTLTMPVNPNGGGARIKDIAIIRGVRGNQLIGYGLVIGLDGTGDSKSAAFTVQSLSNMLQKFGVRVNPTDLKVKNVAAVMVTADLPPFARSGAQIDVMVSSLGDARSLQGGTLLQTPLMGADSKVYAAAQGAVSIGGFASGTRNNGVQKNHVTVGRIPNGAFVEKEVPMAFAADGRMTIELKRPDFATATRVADAVRERFPELNPTAVDGASVELSLLPAQNPVSIIADVQALTVETDLAAKVVVNERTGVVIIGGTVRIKPVVVAQGGIRVSVQTTPVISQPAPLSKGETVKDKVTNVKVEEDYAKITKFGGEMATVDQLVRALQALGVTPQDLISILQALKAQGALEADLEVQ